MSRKANININTFFYPVGNTPAVCLTQDLPCGQNARILLLGCGDVRHILFTAYSEAVLDPPQLDITCCDLEPAILARNILLFTLLVDDGQDSNHDDIWRIYYHLYLSERALGKIKSQALKLCSLASSLTSWHDSEYGRFLRFCDTRTFAKVKNLWHCYSAAGLSTRERKMRARRFRANMDRAREQKAAFMGRGSVLTAYRSAAPLGVQALRDIPTFHEHFWQHGITEQDPIDIAAAKHPNPMFGFPTVEDLTLHDGTDPLLGFHLATAYAPLASNYLAEFEFQDSTNKFSKVVRTARVQFRAWGRSFRDSIKRHLILRFFTGDAVAFCHTLRQNRTEETETSAGWYCDIWGFAPLQLDGGDYATPRSAPVSFDVIDTSNLIDHIGALNLLVGSVPLLAHGKHSTLYTEMLVHKEAKFAHSVETLFCGDYATISLLLGIFPVTYWSNATASAAMEEALLQRVMRSTEDISQKNGQLRSRITWRLSEQLSQFPGEMTVSTSLRFGEEELAHLLFDMYLTMFRDENVPFLFANAGPRLLLSDLNPHHRGSFAILMAYLKARLDIEWDKTVDAFLCLVNHDRSLLGGSSFIQELCLYLHIYISGVYTVQNLENQDWGLDSLGLPQYLATWKQVPSVVCITAKVPRAKLKPITDIPPRRLGKPFLSCALSSATKPALGSWEHKFAALQVGFGGVETRGSRGSNDFQVTIEEDVLAWTGTSPLIVSFLLPTWLVLLGPHAAYLSVQLQPTPQAIATFEGILGPSLCIFETNLGSNDVYITAQRPSHSTPPSLGLAKNKPDIPSSNAALRLSLVANLGGNLRQVTSFKCRIDVMAQPAKTLLESKADVKLSHSSPMSTLLTIGAEGPRCSVTFPMPVYNARTRLRIARKSSYVEIIVPCVVATAEERLSDFMFPLSLKVEKNVPVPVNWNMHHLNLEDLPILDTKRTQAMKWLVTHAALMFSAREGRLRNQVIDGERIMSSIEDCRIAFKDGLFSMLIHFSGLQGEKANVFALDKPNEGGIHVLLFVHALRLDLANHTVVLDVALLPLTEKLLYEPPVARFLSLLRREKVCRILVSDAELRLWKKVLPAFVERCRTWHHHPHSCEYLREFRVPLVDGLDDGKTPLCNCGNGHVPPKFMPGLKIPCLDFILTKYAVRAAISPCFAIPYVEDCINSDSFKRGRLTSTIPNVTPVREPSDESRCASCGRGNATPGANKSGDLMPCGRCRAVRYCSVQCQKSNWKAHKIACTPK